MCHRLVYIDPCMGIPACPVNAIASTPRRSPARHGEPAGGAAIGQVVIATGAALVLIAALSWLVMGHRSGKVPYLGRAADLAERVSGLPGWAALPSGARGGLAARRPARHVLGHLAAHRPRPRRRARSPTPPTT